MTDNRNHPDALLPFHVNGTLDPGEQAQVESHLAGCRLTADGFFK
jgi:anti-sigma factor RsiW